MLLFKLVPIVTNRINSAAKIPGFLHIISTSHYISLSYIALFLYQTKIVLVINLENYFLICQSLHGSYSIKYFCKYMTTFFPTLLLFSEFPVTILKNIYYNKNKFYNINTLQCKSLTNQLLLCVLKFLEKDSRHDPYESTDSVLNSSKDIKFNKSLSKAAMTVVEM